MLESSFSRVRFVFLVQGNDWSNVGKLIFKSSIRLLGSGQWLIECWKAHFQEFDSFSWFRATTDRMLGSSIFKSSIRFLGSGQGLIECWKTHFQEFDSFSWFRATTDRMLESSFSRVRFVFLVQGNNWSNVGKLIFKSSIRFLGSGQRLIECWKARFQEFDSFSWFRATTEENESNSWKWAFQHSISCCPEPRKRIELLKMSFPTFDQSLPWTKKTNRILENELSNIRSVVALNQVNESNSWKWAFQHSISRCPEPRKRIELLKMSFLTLDQSLPWTEKTNRTLENELPNIRSVIALNQENESNSWKWAFQRSISRCPEPSKRIELLKMSFPTFDQSLPWTKKTNRTLENELSNIRSVVALNHRMLENSFSRVRFVYLVQGNDWSNVGKLIFKSSIRFLGSGQRLIECWKAHFQEFDSFSWFRARTDRMLESSFSRVRFVFLVQGNDWRKRIELLKMSFPTFDQSLPWTKKTNRTLENELSNIRSVLALNQENESNSWKWAFQHSISRCPEPRKRIELLKMSFPTLDQSLLWTKKTNRTLENELSNIRSVVALNQENESNSWKWAFQRSISRCPEPRKRIELLKMSFPTLDQSLPWTKKTNRTLENELSNARSVVALNQVNESNSWKRAFQSNQENESNSWKRAFQHSTSRCPEPRNESNSWKWAFQHSISRCPEPRKRIELLKMSFPIEPRKRIELLKMSFPTFDQSLPWTKKTNRTLENELSNIRSVVALNQENESNPWKWAFQHSISRCPEPSNVGKLIFKSSIRFLGSGQGLIECWKTRFQEFDSFSWFRATTDRMLESSFSRVRFIYLVQGNDWSNVGKLIFKSLIRFLGSGQGLIECWKARFQEFDSFSWFRATTDRMLESSFSRVRFVFLVQGNDWSKWIELLKMSFPTFDQSLPWTIKCWKAHFQEFDSFSWFRATTDRMLESSFSRVRFVYLVQGNDWSNVGKLIFKSSIRFLGSGQRLIECWKAQFSRVRFVFLVEGNDWSNVGKLIFKSSIRFLGSGQRLIECWKARFQEFD